MIGNFIIVAAPSGAGKSSLVNAVLAGDKGVKHSISYTTRAPRPGEQDGHEYHFVDVDRFQAMIARGEFLEHALVHGNYYGTSRDWIVAARALDTDIILEIDWQGAQQVRRIFPDAVTVFVLPPSMEELERRLRGRDKDGEEAIRQRMANAADEIAHLAEFDYVIINDNFEQARADLAAIVRAARTKLAVQRERNPDLFSAFRAI
ncbi:MAG: guanylate kinase [Betaproteobacteria bacterium RIFCSPLOWO2_02_FULL_62_17]|nr:MAG: guanylate kinase [Betaproteobacteria bacterium RIFCSPLOWO2_02_FULL_62_17]